MKENLELKKLSNPKSTGGAGVIFENEVQSSFVVLMLSRGIFSPLGNNAKISRLEFQTKRLGYHLDDLLVFATNQFDMKEHKMLVQIKLNVAFTESNNEFLDVMNAAWNDFKNSELFNPQRDKLALITSFLNANDKSIYSILGQAIHASSADDFYDRISKANFTSDQTRKKFDTFVKVLTRANKNEEIEKEDIWKFFKCFNVLVYDLHIQGVCFSFLYTIMEMNSQNNAHSIWCQIEKYTSNVNENAGSIKFEEIPETIKSYFNNNFSLEKNPITISYDIVSEYISEIALLFLLDNFNENNTNDVELIKKNLCCDYNEWINKLRKIIQKENAPISLHNGIWSIKNKRELLDNIKSSIFDEYIDMFSNVAITVFSEIDTQFELDKEQRYCASILGKGCKYSSTLKSGIADTMAILGTFKEEINHCSNNKISNSIIKILRDIFNVSNWQVWASLNNYLSFFAEANPKEFLAIVNKTEEETFENLFAQEGDILTTQNYIIGILRALEILAWDEDYLCDVIMLLGYLSNIDKGGNFGNRPINSIKEILLPWHIQTLATIEKQKIAVQNLNKEYPIIAWEVLVDILPEAHQCAFGTTKPKYRNNIKKDWTYKISNSEYYELSYFYSNFLIEQAKGNIDKLIKILDILTKIPDKLFDNTMKYLSEKVIICSSDDKKYKLWNKLKTLMNKHIKYSYTDWAMQSAKIEKIKRVLSLLKPQNIVYFYIRLFSNDACLDYEIDNKIEDEKYDYRNELLKQRYRFLKKFIENNDFENILFLLINKVENPYELGFTLGKIYNANFDNKFFPNFLLSESVNEQRFISGYIYSKFHYNRLRQIKGNWKWVESINKMNWLNYEISKLYQYLTITPKTFSKIKKLGKNIENDYWKNVKINSWDVKDFIDQIIDKLIFYKRKNSAIELLYAKYHYLNDKNIIVDINKIIEVLSMDEILDEPTNTLNSSETVALIELLQKNENVDNEKLATIEWFYLNWLNSYDGHKPKSLNKELAVNPEYFSQIIPLIYKSENQDEKVKKTNSYQQKMANHAWKLLDKWEMVPGTKEDGTFDYEKFKEWFNFVKERLTKSGHWDVALYRIGQVLYYSPIDNNGFWINKNIAELLNKKENENMRKGYYLKVINSRGAHFVDPEAKPEKELVKKYNDYAKELEKEGFVRFARTIKDIADGYADEARRIIEQYKNVEDID